MAILFYQADFTGETGVKPRLVRLVCNNTYAEVIAAGFLPAANLDPTDYIFATYGSDANTHQIFVPSISNGVVTLEPYIAPGEVVLPVTLNHIAVFASTDGSIGDDPATAIQGGNLQAGLSGTAGYLASFPGTASKGSLRLTAADNVGNTVTTITNASMGQASVMTIPDPGTATANFAVAPAALVNGNLVSASGTAGRVADAGIATTNVQLKTQVKSGTVSNGGGSASFNIAVTGLTASSIVVCNFQSQANAASILTSTAGTDQISIVASANPGVCVVQYVAYIVGQ